MELAPVYPILNVAGDHSDERHLAEQAAALGSSGCTVVQLRAKTLSSGRFLSAGLAVATRLQGSPCTLIINDRVDIALAIAQRSGATVGVHLGQDDLPANAARALLGPAAPLGLSTHTVEQASAVDDAMVDYIGFGPIFESLTKPGARSPRGTQNLARACEASRVPVVAIGGITIAEARAVFTAGAASIALIRELQTAEDAPALAKRYQDLFLTLHES